MISNSTYAFVLDNCSVDWKLSIPDDWDISVIELSGTEEVLGHKKIDGAICKVVKTNDGKIVAITK